MPVSAKMYNLAFTSAFNKEIDWGTDAIKVMLTTSSYTPSQTTHQYKSSVTNEVVGTGYTARGATLGTKTEAFTGQVKAFDAADVSWTTSTITARYAVIYDDATGVDATAPLIAYVDFGADVVSTGGTFAITWDSAGICSVTVA
jgi:hypothetical protein